MHKADCAVDGAAVGCKLLQMQLTVRLGKAGQQMPVTLAKPTCRGRDQLSGVKVR